MKRFWKWVLCRVRHRRVFTHPEDGYAGGMHCARCGTVIWKPVVWPTRPVI